VRRLALLATLTLVAVSCTSARVARPPAADATLRGTASWYGQEFAGRTTANGEIFDPMRLTAAHRTLPFGTIVDVTNPANGRTVRVRINDRGPFIGDRVVDLSFAAADRIGLVQAGVGPVELKIVKLGAGEYEPPAPYVVGGTSSAFDGDAPPPVPFPLPGSPPQASEPVIVDRVEVLEESGGVETRKRVADDGRTIVGAPRSSPPPPQQSRSVPPAARESFVLQVGAFESRSNAENLKRRIEQFAGSVFIEQAGNLHRVRVGPFATREAAIAARERLDAAGIASMLLPVR
jgi:rare lipoprotein A